MTRKDIMRSLIFLSIPTIIEEVLSTLLQYVDTAMVGHLGEEATAAVSTTTTINWLVGSVPHAIGIAFLALIARECGAKHTERTKQLSGEAFTISLWAGAIMMAVCLSLSGRIPVWMHAEDKVIPKASAYFFILSLSMIPRMLNIVYGAALRAVKDTRTPMVINLWENGLNIILNVTLIYGFHLGVIGAAIGSAISYTISGFAMVIVARRKEELHFRGKNLRILKENLEEILRIGIPALLTSVASCLGYVFFAGMVSYMGTTTFAAHSIAVTAEQLFYIPGYGLRTATSSLVGNSIGEGDAKKQSIIESLSIMITVSFMVLTGILLYLVAYPLMSLFTNSVEVASIGAKMLRLVAFTEPFFGLMIVMEGIFYGTGRTKVVFFVETFSMWGIRIILTYFVTKVWFLGLTEVWYCMIADNIFKAVSLFLVYWWSKRIKNPRKSGM